MKGYIGINKTVWCGTCVEWESVYGRKHAIELGWKQSRKHGWICPLCQCEHKNKSKNKDKQGTFCFDCKRYIE